VLIFACTDDKHVNRHILEIAQAVRVPCCCADGNWSEGDFVTPAIVRAGEVLIAVSTSGKSCLQSRLIKDNFRKHLDSIESSDLLVLGTSHEYMTSEERAPYHLLLREREKLGEMIRQIWGVHEFLILNTCNRIEIVAAVSKEASTSGILRRLLRFDSLRPDLYYVKQGFDAFAHVCHVAAGMDSQTPGEVHIVAQLKDAIEEAMTCGWAGPILRGLCDSALRVSKDIRQAVEPLLDVLEIEDVALRYLDEFKKTFSPWGKTVLVIGTGVVGKGLIAGLLARHCSCIWAYHRNIPHIDEQHAPHIEMVQLGELRRVLPKADVVISAVNVQEPVVTAGLHGDRFNPSGVVLVDLGMPHNIETALHAPDAHRHLVGLDTLKHWARAANAAQTQVSEVCATVVASHRDSYERIRNNFSRKDAEAQRFF
jgi:glutamyl-tRNA reductase